MKEMQNRVIWHNWDEKAPPINELLMIGVDYGYHYADGLVYYSLEIKTAKNAIKPYETTYWCKVGKIDRKKLKGV